MLVGLVEDVDADGTSCDAGEVAERRLEMGPILPLDGRVGCRRSDAASSLRMQQQQLEVSSNFSVEASVPTVQR